METMHMFWNALTSENQLIMSIISIPCTFLEVYLYMQIFTTILKIETDKKKKLIFVVLYSIVALLNTYNKCIIIATLYKNIEYSYFCNYNYSGI